MRKGELERGKEAYSREFRGPRNHDKKKKRFPESVRNQKEDRGVDDTIGGRGGEIPNKCSQKQTSSSFTERISD